MASAAPTASLRGTSPGTPEAEGTGPPLAAGREAPRSTWRCALCGLHRFKGYKFCARGKARQAPWALRRWGATLSGRAAVRGKRCLPGQDAGEGGGLPERYYPSDMATIG